MGNKSFSDPFFDSFQGDSIPLSSLQNLQKEFHQQFEASRSGSSDRLIQALPFSVGDVTAGSENEYQAVVIGSKHSVDLAISLEASNFFKNLVKRAQSEKHTKRLLQELQTFLNHASHDVWENS